jgi:molybdopterin-guanine dinucleotide biosynthesis protein A
VRSISSAEAVSRQEEYPCDTPAANPFAIVSALVRAGRLLEAQASLDADDGFKEHLCARLVRAATAAGRRDAAPPAAS